MDKIVVTMNEEDQTLGTVLLVHGYNEGFQTLLQNVTDEWNRSEEEFYNLLCKRASETGYQIEFPDFLTYFC